MVGTNLQRKSSLLVGILNRNSPHARILVAKFVPTNLQTSVPAPLKTRGILQPKTLHNTLKFPAIVQALFPDNHVPYILGKYRAHSPVHLS